MRRNNMTYAMSVSGLMLALMLVFGFTPAGTIQTAGLTITLMGIPVAIIACLFGPLAGALAGLAWGTISLIQGVTGMDSTGPVLMEYSTIGLVITVYIPRILAGGLSGLFYDLMRKKDKNGYLSALVSSLAVSILNTVFFMTSFYLFYKDSDLVKNLASSLHSSTGWDTSVPIVFIAAMVGINFLVEVAVNGVVGSACAFGVKKAADRMGLESPFKKKKNPEATDKIEEQENPQA